MKPGLRSYGFSLAFGLTGVGTALLGAALPATLQQWRLTDSRGGLLLFCSWSGSTFGTFFVRNASGWSAIPGMALSAAALLAMSLPLPPALPLLYLAFGLGLGITMTSISTMRSAEVHAAEADIELNRLNLIWAVGALLAPLLALHALKVLSISGLFRLTGWAVAAGTALLLAMHGHSSSPEPEPPVILPTQLSHLHWAPLRYSLFAAAAVGLESALGSWLTTYTERRTHGVGTAVSATTAFWAGLLLSRAAHSLRGLPWMHTHAARRWHIALVGAASLLLILVPLPAVLALAALLAGVGLGPLYPYVLSVVLPRYRSSAVFFFAGIGASVVPWATGALSTASGSLRMGLLVPCAWFLLLLLPL